MPVAVDEEEEWELNNKYREEQWEEDREHDEGL